MLGTFVNFALFSFSLILIVSATGLSGCATSALPNVASNLISNGLNPPPKNGIHYEGYSQKMVENVKPRLTGGDLETAYQTYLKVFSVPQNEENFFPAVEAGLLALDSGHENDSRKYFDQAERYLDLWWQQSLLKEKSLQSAQFILSEATGVEDMTSYVGEPYERILALNYKAIAYLLDGRREAYNVTRRAITWQNAEKKHFADQIRQAKVNKDNPYDYDPETGETKHVGSRNAGRSAKGVFVLDTIFKQYQVSKDLRVPNAFVNPLGFYLAGVIQEFDSLKDPSLRDNARISYRKAAQLNAGNSQFKRFIKQVVKAARRKPKRGRRLVHLIVADGFSPEKKIQSITIPAAGSYITVKLPLFGPTPSRVSKIQVKSSGKTLATLAPVADVEALVLRHQYDRLPLEHFKMAVTITRNVFENQLWNSLGPMGMVAKLARESLTSPDTRSWMTLPKTVYAARLELPKRLSSLQLVSYDAHGRILADKTIALPENQHCFVYARSIDAHIYPQVSKKLWVN